MRLILFLGLTLAFGAITAEPADDDLAGTNASNPAMSASAPARATPAPQNAAAAKTETLRVEAPDSVTAKNETQDADAAAVSADELRALSAGNRAFAIDLYRQLAVQPGNLAFSPFSISTALALSELGARGETAAEMRQVLHLGLEAERLHRGFKALQARLVHDEEGQQLAIANRLWPAEDLDILPGYQAQSQELYGAMPQPLDFGQPDAARERINTWVEDNTAGKIVDLLIPPDVTASTRLVLTNALYFKGTWARQFDQADTGVQSFFGESEIEVPMMHLTAEVPYVEDDAVQVIELSYVGDELSMLVILPRARDGLAALETVLDAETLERWLEGLGPREVRIALPRFKGTSRFELAPVLGALGMQRAFSGGDFSGMTTAERLAFSKVIHQAVVEVNEEGAEAAAATAVVMGKGMIQAPPIPVFTADHPFLYLIYDQALGNILFMGRVSEPDADAAGDQGPSARTSSENPPRDLASVADSDDDERLQQPMSPESASGVEPEMVTIRGGRFLLMGSPEGEAGRAHDERPGWLEMATSGSENTR